MHLSVIMSSLLMFIVRGFGTMGPIEKPYVGLFIKRIPQTVMEQAYWDISLKVQANSC